jgi:hypothetical protein
MVMATIVFMAELSCFVAAAVDIGTSAALRMETESSRVRSVSILKKEAVRIFWPEGLFRVLNVLLLRFVP